MTPGPSDPHLPPPDHARHDPLVVAAAADRGGRLPPELAACPDCQALHADLVALAVAVPTAALPSRPRDFSLTPTDAARLRPAGWRGWLGRIGTSRDLVTRPLAIGLTTLGLAGLLVATVPSVLPSAGSTAGTGAAMQGAKAVTPAPTAESVLAAPAPAASPLPSAGARTGATDVAGAASEAPTSADLAVGGEAPAVPPLTVVAGGLLAAGLALFGLRRSAGRT